MDMCMYCKNSTTVNSTTTHVVNYKNCIIVIKNVPCLECEQCGEKYYTDEVAERLETIVNMATFFLCIGRGCRGPSLFFFLSFLCTIQSIAFGDFLRKSSGIDVLK